MEEPKEKSSDGNKKRLRNHVIRAWLSDSEYHILQEKIELCNMSISQYMREMIAHGVIINYAPFDIKAVIYEMNHIGTNINQIAKRVNEFSAISPDDFEELKRAYEELWNLYMEKLYSGVE